jgi:hypothetical protein
MNDYVSTSLHKIGDCPHSMPSSNHNRDNMHHDAHLQTYLCRPLVVTSVHPFLWAKQPTEMKQGLITHSQAKVISKRAKTIPYMAGEG